jgi:hypothetical protein
LICVNAALSGIFYNGILSDFATITAVFVVAPNHIPAALHSL